MNNPEVMEAGVKQAGKAYIYIIALIVAGGSFVFGYDIVIMSGAILFLKEQFALTAKAEGFAMASAGFGVMAGILMSGYVIDRLGRKQTIIWASILFGISALGTAFPKTFIDWRTLLNIRESGLSNVFIDWNVYRILGGIGGGLAIMVAPVYIAEFAPADKRGVLVMMFQLAQVLGAALSNVAAYYLAHIAEADSSFPAWRWMFGSACVPAILLLVGLIFVPGSPRWLVQRGRIKEAQHILTRINGPEHAKREILEIQDSLEQETGKFSELFQPGIRIALIIAVGLLALQSLAGVSTVIYYAPSIFQEAGLALKSEAIKHTIILVAWNITCTIVALFLIDRLGRRLMLLWGTLGMMLGQMLIAISFQMHLRPAYLLTAMFVAIGFYILSLAPVTWVVVSEIFPTRIRARGVAIAGFISSLAGQAINYVFPIMRDEFQRRFGNPSGNFWFFAAICLLAFLFTYYLVPETKHKTLEEIASFWTSKQKTRTARM